MTGRLLTIMIGLMLAGVTWVRPEIGIMLQVLWLTWIGFWGLRRHQWFLVEAFCGLFLVHYLLEVRGQGEEGWALLLDFPYQMVACYIVWRGRRERPWWLIFLATSPLVHWPLVEALNELGLIPQMVIDR